VYARPTARATAEKVQFGAVLVVSRGGKHVTTLHTERGFYPSTSAADGIISRFFDSSNADSTVGLDAGPLRDIWTVVNSRASNAMVNEINRGDTLFTQELNSMLAKTKGMTVAQQNAAVANTGIWTLRDEAVAGIVRQYVTHPFPVEFLLIVSPLVTWLWSGAVIIALGGLIAIWPAPLALRRRSPAVERAPQPLARELV
jgi:hypothetical protein